MPFSWLPGFPMNTPFLYATIFQSKGGSIRKPGDHEKGKGEVWTSCLSHGFLASL